MIFSGVTVDSFLCRVTGSFPTLAYYHKIGKFSQGRNYGTVIFYDAIIWIKKENRFSRKRYKKKSLSVKLSGFQSKNFMLKEFN